MAWKVVITDVDFPSVEAEMAMLAGIGAEVVRGQCTTEAEALEIAKDACALLVQYGRSPNGSSHRSAVAG